MKLLPLGALICAFALFGCVHQEKVWLKPGATPADFTTVRYACLQQSQQPTSGAYVGRYGGYATSNIITNDTLFSACMNSQGWSLAEKIPATGSSPYKDALEAEIAELVQVCSSEDLKVLFRKMSCLPKDATLAQLSDRSKISAEEKTALTKWRAAVSDSNKKVAAVHRQHNGEAYVSMANKIQVDGEKKALELYSGQIAWGEYNKWRLERAN